MPECPARERFSALRGARWRADLGVLPDFASVSTEEFRRAAADSRRRYANLRRRLLIDPHLSKDEENAPDLVVENPLSQNPESTWGQYFRNAELEKMLNQDLSRLYPELGNFFQTTICQSMLGRILLVWSLRYPELGYKQESSTGLTPVREASSAIYHLLASVDSPLHSHLVELGVEPQYFALRWLRVLFGREFSLDNLLFIWDEIFSSPNHSYCADIKNRADYQFKILCSHRGALILSMAVSMMLHLRSSLLGSEHATSCLVRLLNFPGDTDLKSLIDKAKLLQPFALEANLPSSPLRGKSPLNPPNYWEETWKILQMSEEKRSGGSINRMKVRGLFRRSNPSTESNVSRTKDANFEDSNLTSENMSTTSNNVLEAGQHEVYRSSSVDVRDALGVACENLSRDSSTSLSCGMEYDHETHHADEPCASHDDKVVSEPDPLPVHNDKIDEVTIAAIQTCALVDYQQSQQNKPCSVNGKSEVKYQQNFSVHEVGCKETFELGSSSDVADKELLGTLRLLGESMVENIEVIDLLFQPNLHSTSLDKSEEIVLGSIEQAKAKAALEGLKKISELLRRI
uniref:Rab-GAP TBC domain-containing protein n=1 Tax=Oryza meridionalis TaxID=40149 RepID=A0A0E0E4T0_9ORYZ